MKTIAWRESESIRYAIVSQFVFLGTLLICVALQPGLLLENQPISMFGNVRATVVPFVAGFLLTAGILFRAAQSMPTNSHNDRQLRKVFAILGIVMVGLAVTPFTVNVYLYYSHGIFAGVFYLTALWTGYWLLQKRQWRDAWSVFIYATMATGITGAILSTSEVGALDLLATCQLLTIASFSVLLIRSVAHAETLRGLQKETP
jgi:hypothetical protein